MISIITEVSFTLNVAVVNDVIYCYCNHYQQNIRCTYLLESDVIGVITETAPANVQAVFADQTMSVVAHTAIHNMIMYEQSTVCSVLDYVV